MFLNLWGILTAPFVEFIVLPIHITAIVADYAIISKSYMQLIHLLDMIITAPLWGKYIAFKIHI